MRICKVFVSNLYKPVSIQFLPIFKEGPVAKLATSEVLNCFSLMAFISRGKERPVKTQLLRQSKIEFEKRRRWHQAKAIQQTPRYSRIEGSPSKSRVPLTSRGTLRRPPGLKQFGSNEKDKGQEETTRTAPTPFRLPRLSETRSIFERPKDYVYKQPNATAHFLIQKDPKRATPIPDCTSPDLRIKPNSTKCRPVTQSFRRNLMYQALSHEGAKLHRLLPKLNRPHGVIVLTDGQSTEPKTPPQSEAEYGVLPSLHRLPVSNSSRQLTASGQISHTFAPVLTSDDSDERKLHWQLSPYSNKNFDRQGLGPNQGPFSREMPIKCMPPNNWLRMKLRQRIGGKL